MIDKCDKDTERGENQCDFVFRMYKCLWTAIKNAQESESLRNSFDDVFGFNELFDEGEIKAELESETEESEEKKIEEKDKEVEEVHVV